MWTIQMSRYCRPRNPRVVWQFYHTWIAGTPVQRVVAWCCVLQCVAVCCSVLQCVAVWYSVSALLPVGVLRRHTVTRVYRQRAATQGALCCSVLHFSHHHLASCGATMIGRLPPSLGHLRKRALFVKRTPQKCPAQIGLLFTQKCPAQRGHV